MNEINGAVERIRSLECPTGEIEKRVAGILQDYGIADSSNVKITRDKRYDRDGTEAYNIRIPGVESSIMIFARSGLDDYVAKVIDAYMD